MIRTPVNVLGALCELPVSTSVVRDVSHVRFHAEVAEAAERVSVVNALIYYRAVISASFACSSTESGNTDSPARSACAASAGSDRRR